MFNPFIVFVSGLLAIFVPLLALLYRSMFYIRFDHWPTLNAGVVGLEAPDFLHCESALFWYKTCVWLWHAPIEIFAIVVAIVFAVLLRILLLLFQKILA